MCTLFLAGLRERLAKRYQEVKERDKRTMLDVDLARVNRFLFYLFILYLVLNFLDVLSTLIAITFGPEFHEFNLIAAGLFDKQMEGFLIALLLKYSPVAPFFYVVFLRAPGRTGPVTFRVLKVGFLVALVAADVLYIAVNLNNFMYLLRASD